MRTSLNHRIGRWGRGGKIPAILAVIVVLIILLAITLPLVFLQFREVQVSESREVPFQDEVTDLQLNLRGNIGHLDVRFEEASSNLVELQASVQGRSDFFGTKNPLTMEFDYEIVSQSLVLNVTLNTYAPWPYYAISRVDYRLMINPLLYANLNMSMTSGGIAMNTTSDATLGEVQMMATAGGVYLGLAQGTTVAGNLTIRTATGGTEVDWNEVNVVEDILVEMRESSGKLDLNLTQSSELNGNVTLKMITTAGGIALGLDVGGEVSASIRSQSTIGGVDVRSMVGFAGEDTFLISTNYPSDVRFDATLNNTVGGILVWANYTA